MTRSNHLSYTPKIWGSVAFAGKKNNPRWMIAMSASAKETLATKSERLVSTELFAYGEKIR